jgi:hypothetical protein
MYEWWKVKKWEGKCYKRVKEGEVKYNGWKRCGR